MNAPAYFLRGARGLWLGCVLLLLAVTLTYLPVTRAGFLWDDDLYITSPSLNGWRGLEKIWTSERFDISPLASSTLWLERNLWGAAPLGFHLVSVLLHGGCAMALWRVLRELRVPGAWLGAALWALHPVQVESVAWASELKNPESGVFFLVAILFFMKWQRAGGARNYGLSVFLGALAMASKSSTVVLPVVLLLCAWWVEGRWRRREVLGTIPFFLLSAVASLASIRMVSGQLAQAGQPGWVPHWPERLANAGMAVWFYLGKLVWPHPLMTIYPRWETHAGAPWAFVPLVGVIAALAGLWMLRRTCWKGCFFAFAYFIVALLPVLGFVEQYILQYAPVFDHFQYLASMGPLALAGAGLSRLADFAGHGGRWLSAGVLLVLSVVSWQRAAVYHDSIVYWQDATEKNPQAWVAYNNLADALNSNGRADEALADAGRALQLNPQYAQGYLTLGSAYLAENRLEEAIKAYNRAAELAPRYDLPYCDTGSALLLEGKAQAAESMLRKALELDPGRVMSHQRLGDSYLAEGKRDAAKAEYEHALDLDADDARAYLALGLIDAQDGRLDEAIAHYEEGLKLDPGNPDARNDFGNVLLQAGRAEDAAREYERCLELTPGDAVTMNNLGAAYFRLGRWDEAIAQFRKVVATDPRNAPAHDRLGLALAKKGATDDATAEFTRALQLDPGDALARRSLDAEQARKPAVGK